MHNEILFSHKIGNPAICDSMDESWPYHASEISKKKTNIVWSHSCVESKNNNINKFTETEQIVVCQDQMCVGRIGEGCQSVQTFSYKMN